MAISLLAVDQARRLLQAACFSGFFFHLESQEGHVLALSVWLTSLSAAPSLPLPCVRVCVCAWRLEVKFGCCPPYFLRLGIFIDLGLTNTARLTDQRAPRILLPPHWRHKCVPPHTFSYGCWGILRSLCSHTKPVTNLCPQRGCPLPSLPACL